MPPHIDSLPQSVRLDTRIYMICTYIGQKPHPVKSFILGKFNTSVISENLLFSSGLIAQPLYLAALALGLYLIDRRNVGQRAA